MADDAMMVVVVTGDKAPASLRDAFNTIGVATVVVRANDLTCAALRRAPGVIVTGTRAWPHTQSADAVIQALAWMEEFDTPTMAIGRGHEAIASIFGGHMAGALSGRRDPLIHLDFWGGSAEEQTLTGEYKVTTDREVIGAPIGWEPKVRGPRRFNRRPIEIMFRTNGRDSMISLSFRPELSGALGQRWITGMATRCGLYTPPSERVRFPTRSVSPPQYIRATGGRSDAEWNRYINRTVKPRFGAAPSRFQVEPEPDDLDGGVGDLFGDDAPESPPGFWNYAPRTPSPIGEDDSAKRNAAIIELARQLRTDRQ